MPATWGRGSAGRAPASTRLRPRELSVGRPETATVPATAQVGELSGCIRVPLQPHQWDWERICSSESPFSCGSLAPAVEPCANVSCSAPPACRVSPGVCDPSTGRCQYPSATDGTQCGKGGMCSTGQCSGAGPLEPLLHYLTQHACKTQLRFLTSQFAGDGQAVIALIRSAEVVLIAPPIPVCCSRPLRRTGLQQPWRLRGTAG